MHGLTGEVEHQLRCVNRAAQECSAVEGHAVIPVWAERRQYDVDERQVSRVGTVQVVEGQGELDILGT